MTRLIYDGSFEGLLTAIFEIYDRKLGLVNIEKNEVSNSALFEDVIHVITDEKRAKRVLNGLSKKLSPEGIQRVYIAHMGGLANEDNMVVGFIRYALDSPVNIEGDYGNKYVMHLSASVVKMRRERHRMEAFIRFQQLSDGTFYAAIEPDFNVLPLLIKHFKNRYADQKWMIYDLKRKYGLYYDLNEVEFIEMEFSSVQKPGNVIALFNEDESVYQHLWKNYFTSVNIVSRKNTKLHVRHIPKRYWKYLTEKFN